MNTYARRGAIISAAVAMLWLGGCGGGSGSAGTAGGSTPPPAEELALHVASPDWQDQIIYFVMTDRFNDGDPSNNDQGEGEYDPANGAKFSGGDLRGIQQKLDYIKGLGATTLWITPPVANQWWDPLVNYGGYHGYWAQNFTEVDKHFGTLADYKQLSSALHKNGMYLVQDIVLNHTGNFFSYVGGYDAADPTKFLVMNTGSTPVKKPTQAPFNLNDPRDPAAIAAGIYHWTSAIANYQDANQEQNYQLADLDDLNTENPVVRDALRKSYGYWIKEVGVDGFRIDTAFYVTPGMMRDFMQSTDAGNPGMAAAAKATGRSNFLAFGEGFGIDRAYEDTQEKKIDRYMTDSATGDDILPGMINFPLYGTAGDVFARGRPTAELGYRIRTMIGRHKRPQLMPSFLENHDVDRFLAGGTEAGLRQNLLMMMTLPGIPVIYYGTEQAFKEQRGAMFKSGYRSGGSDHFDTSAPLYQYIAKASALRRANKVLSRGTPTVIRESAAAAGALAYKMEWQGQTAIVVFNTAETDTLLDNLDTGIANAKLKPLFSASGDAPAVAADANGKLSLRLPARAAYVWIVDGTDSAATASGTLTMTALADAKETGDFTVSGTSSGVSSFKLVVDGDIARAKSVTPAGDGSWSATVDTSAMTDATIRHSIVAWSEATGAISATGTFFVERAWIPLATVTDPVGDDVGPSGGYQYPTDDSWGINRQLDIRKVTVSGAGSGGAMRIDVQTNKVTTVWNPQNGFDHVAFTIFVQIPGQPGGINVMPLQNATLPGGMNWNYRLRVHGWSNALFSASGASAGNEGSAVAPAAEVSVDQATNTVSFILTGAALGSPTTLSGAKVYVTTWDYDGGYRGLFSSAQQWAFWGGASTDPLVMDSTGPITLP